MHEFGMCEALVGAVERRAEGRQVAAVGVRVGARHRVVPEAFEQAFEMAAGGTVAEGADLELVTVPAQGSCDGCGGSFTTEEVVPACPQCGSVTVAVEGGEELMLEWLRYRAPQAAGSQ